MNQARDIERILDHWLSDGPTQAPDRVVDIVAGRIERQSQRRMWRLDWRLPQVNLTLKLATAVAALGVVAVLGYNLLPIARNGAAGPPKPVFEVVGRFSAAMLGLDRPVGLAIGPNGDVYVTESGDRVSQISPDGAVVRRWGTTGSGTGQFDFNGLQTENGAYASIAVGPDGKVYVSDSDNHRVQVFTGDGAFVRQFGTSGQGPGQFGLAYDLSADAAGDVYVLDDILMRLSKFGPDGSFVWSASGSTDSELAGHGHSARIDGKGRVVVANDDTGQVVYVGPDGRVVDAFLPAGGACGLSLDKADDEYIGGCGGQVIDVYSPAHALIASWTDPTLASTPQFGPNGEAFALDKDGAIVRLRVNLPRG